MQLARLALASLAAAAVAVPAAAAVTTVTFDDLAADTPNYISVGQAYVSGGLQFVSSSPNRDVPHGLAIWSKTSANNADPGGATLFQGAANAFITVSRVGGGVFTLKSLDLGDLFNAGSGGPIAFRWTDAAGEHLQNLNFDLAPGLQTFDLNLAGVTSFRLTQDAPYFQLDNVVVETAAIPEPGAWALMILGFGAAGAALRRRTAVSL